MTRPSGRSDVRVCTVSIDSMEIVYTAHTITCTHRAINLTDPTLLSKVEKTILILEILAKEKPLIAAMWMPLFLFNTHFLSHDFQIIKHGDPATSFANETHIYLSLVECFWTS